MVAASESGRVRLSRSTKAILLSPVVIIFASAARLLVVCNYDTRTATTVAAAGGLAGTLLGTIVPLLPPFLPALLLVLVIARRYGFLVLTGLATAFIAPVYTSVTRARSDALATITETAQRMSGGEWAELWVEATQWADWWLAALAGAVGAAVAVWDPPGWMKRPAETAARREKGDHRLWRVVSRYLFFPAIYFVVCALSLLLVKAMYRVPTDWSTFSDILRRPWVPTEQVELKAGPPQVGYTLATKDGWHMLLIEDGRTIKYTPAASVADRQVCTLGGLQDLQSLPLIKLKGAHRPSLPACP